MASLGSARVLPAMGPSLAMLYRECKTEEDREQFLGTRLLSKAEPVLGDEALSRRVVGLILHHFNNLTDVAQLLDALETESRFSAMVDDALAVLGERPREREPARTEPEGDGWPQEGMLPMPPISDSRPRPAGDAPPVVGTRPEEEAGAWAARVCKNDGTTLPAPEQQTMRGKRPDRPKGPAVRDRCGGGSAAAERRYARAARQHKRGGWYRLADGYKLVCSVLPHVSAFEDGIPAWHPRIAVAKQVEVTPTTPRPRERHRTRFRAPLRAGDKHPNRPGRRLRRRTAPAKRSRWQQASGCPIAVFLAREEEKNTRSMLREIRSSTAMAAMGPADAPVDAWRPRRPDTPEAPPALATIGRRRRRRPARRRDRRGLHGGNRKRKKKARSRRRTRRTAPRSETRKYHFRLRRPRGRCATFRLLAGRRRTDAELLATALRGGVEVNPGPPKNQRQRAPTTKASYNGLNLPDDALLVAMEFRLTREEAAELPMPGPATSYACWYHGQPGGCNATAAGAACEWLHIGDRSSPLAGAAGKLSRIRIRRKKAGYASASPGSLAGSRQTTGLALAQGSPILVDDTPHPGGSRRRARHAGTAEDPHTLSDSASPSRPVARQLLVGPLSDPLSDGAATASPQARQPRWVPSGVTLFEAVHAEGLEEETLSLMSRLESLEQQSRQIKATLDVRRSATNPLDAAGREGDDDDDGTASRSSRRSHRTAASALTEGSDESDKESHDSGNTTTEEDEADHAANIAADQRSVDQRADDEAQRLGRSKLAGKIKMTLALTIPLLERLGANENVAKLECAIRACDLASCDAYHLRDMENYLGQRVAHGPAAMTEATIIALQRATYNRARIVGEFLEAYRNGEKRETAPSTDTLNAACNELCSRIVGIAEPSVTQEVYQKALAVAQTMIIGDGPPFWAAIAGTISEAANRALADEFKDAVPGKLSAIRVALADAKDESMREMEKADYEDKVARMTPSERRLHDLHLAKWRTTLESRQAEMRELAEVLEVGSQVAREGMLRSFEKYLTSCTEEHVHAPADLTPCMFVDTGAPPEKRVVVCDFLGTLEEVRLHENIKHRRGAELQQIRDQAQRPMEAVPDWGHLCTLSAVTTALSAAAGLLEIPLANNNSHLGRALKGPSVATAFDLAANLKMLIGQKYSIDDVLKRLVHKYPGVREVAAGEQVVDARCAGCGCEIAPTIWHGGRPLADIHALLMAEAVKVRCPSCSMVAPRPRGRKRTYWVDVSLAPTPVALPRVLQFDGETLELAAVIHIPEGRNDHITCALPRSAKPPHSTWVQVKRGRLAFLQEHPRKVQAAVYVVTDSIREPERQPRLFGTDGDTHPPDLTELGDEQRRATDAELLAEAMKGGIEVHPGPPPPRSSASASSDSGGGANDDERPQDLVVMSWNVGRGLSTQPERATEIATIARTLHADVIALQEVGATWSPSIDAALANGGFTVIDKKLRGSAGGGVALAVRSALRARPTKDSLAEPPVEAVGIDVLISQQRHTVWSVYWPPDNWRRQDDPEARRNRPAAVKSWLVGLPSRRTVIAGDFNARDPMWCSSTTAGQHASGARGRMIRDCGWRIANQRPPRGTGSWIPRGDAAGREHTSPDLMLASVDLAGHATIRPVDSWSDHQPLVAEFATNRVRPLQRRSEGVSARKRRVRWTEANKRKFCAALESDRLFANHSAPVEATTTSHRRFVAAVHRALGVIKCPTRRFRRRSSCRAVKVKWKSFESFVKGANPFEVYRAFTDGGPPPLGLLGDDEDEMRQIFLDATAALHANPAASPPEPEPPPPCRAGSSPRIRGPDVPAVTRDEVLTAIRRHAKKKAADPDGITAEVMDLITKVEPAVGFLRDMIDDCLRSGEVPRQWKDAITVPLLKRGKPAGEAASYRPVALTSYLSRTAERVALHRCLAQLETLSGGSFAEQMAYLASCDPREAMTRLLGPIKRDVKSGNPGIALLFDFSSAFCRVTKAEVMRCLEEIGVPAYIRTFIGNWLTGRRTRIRLQASDTLSAWTALDRGCPQGSILGPYLWIAVAHSLKKGLDEFGSSKNATLRGVRIATTLFADDVAVFMSLKEKRHKGASRSNCDTLKVQAAEAMRYVEHWAHERDIAVSTKTVAHSLYHKSRPQFLCTGAHAELSAKKTNERGLWKLDIRSDNLCNIGFHMTPALELTAEGLGDKLSEAISAIRRIRLAGRHPVECVKLWTAYGLSRLRYSMIDGWVHRPEDLEALHARGAKAAMGLHATTNGALAVRVAGMRSVGHALKCQAAAARARREAAIGAGKAANCEAVFPCHTLMPGFTVVRAADYACAAAKEDMTEEECLEASERAVERALELAREYSPDVDPLILATDGSVDLETNASAAAFLVFDRRVRDGGEVLARGNEPVGSSATSFSAEAVAARAGLAAAADLNEGTDRPRPVVWILDSLSYCDRVDAKGAILEREELILSAHVQRPRVNAPIFAAHVYSHCGQPENEMADEEAKALDSSSLRPRWWKDSYNVVRAELEAEEERGVEVTLCRLQAKPAKLTMSMDSEDTRLLAQLKAGCCPSLGGTLHGGYRPCYRCKAVAAMGRGGASVRHMFACTAPEAVELRGQHLPPVEEGEELCELLWRDPKAALKYAKEFWSASPANAGRHPRRQDSDDDGVDSE